MNQIMLELPTYSFTKQVQRRGFSYNTEIILIIINLMRIYNLFGKIK